MNTVSDNPSYRTTDDGRPGYNTSQETSYETSGNPTFTKRYTFCNVGPSLVR